MPSPCHHPLTNITIKAIHDDNDDVEIDANWLPVLVFDLPAHVAISFMELDLQQGLAQTLFNHITAPALRSIQYYGLELFSDIPIGTMITIIQRSSRNIYDLPHTEADDVGAALLPLLHAMPSLRMRELSLDDAVSIKPLSLSLLLANGLQRPDLPTLFLPQFRKLQCPVHPPFNWMLLPGIYIPTNRNGSQIGDPDFRFSEMGIRWARQRLSGDLTLRSNSEGAVDEDGYVSSNVDGDQAANSGRDSGES
ncbi:hypothetical protein D9619_012328 [Psilocybe cf. subviscida]|uniref:Uncharacterized protein n=1 Tax=Psilocybe cf. subviscida TaxID=2480587 RepID=A0A8H5ARI8_9AGAR|nr:hypothetical protein D9619_012328 [Psilocybe cf. subviscida]